MAKVRMTDRFVAAVKATDGERPDYFDTVTRGLVLRVAPGGHKAWSYFYTSPRDGKRARISLGSYPAVGLAMARTKALEAAGHVAGGSDPRRTLKASAAMTVSDLVRAYLADPRKLRLRTVDEIKRRLRRDVVPMIGEIRIAELGRRDVRNVFEPIERDGKPVAARRAFEDVRAMVRWAVEHEYLPSNPIDGMKGPAIGAPRERSLSEREIKTLWAALPKVLPKSYQRVVQLCLVTGQRLGEVSGMHRGELHLTGPNGICPARGQKTSTRTSSRSAISPSRSSTQRSPTQAIPPSSFRTTVGRCRAAWCRGPFRSATRNSAFRVGAVTTCGGRRSPTWLPSACRRSPLLPLPTTDP
jgi:hypothetical protein